MKNLLQKVKRDKYQWITFLIALIPRIICSSFSATIRTISDETATISSGALFAGLDWSGIVSGAGYYGGGFSALFSIFFRLTDNPYIIYHSILIVCCVLQALTAVICFSIVNNYFKINNKIIISLISIASSYMVVTRANVAYNEHMLIFVSWIVAWLLVKLDQKVRTEQSRIKLTVILLLLLSYALTIHTRAITYWIILALVVLVYFILERKWLISIPAGILTGGTGYVCSKIFINYIKDKIWLASSGEVLRNTTVKVDGAENLLNPEYWQSWFSIIFGQLNTASVITGGCLIIACVLWVCLVRNTICENLLKAEKKENDRLILLVLSYFVMCFGMTIVGQSVTWLSDLKTAMETGFGSDSYAWKAVTYVRYFGPYCGPMLMAVLSYGVKYREQMSRLYKVGAGFIIGLQAFWIVLILPYIHSNIYVFETYLPFSGQKSTMLSVDTKYFIIAGVCLGIVYLIMYLSYRYKKVVIGLSVLTIFLGYQYVYNAINYDVDISRSTEDVMTGGYDSIKQLEGEIELPKTIYVIDAANKSDHQNFFYYQFMLNRYTIVGQMPEKDVETAVVITRTLNDCAKYLEEQNYKIARINQSEYMMVKGEEMQKQIIGAGIQLEDYVPIYMQIDMASMGSNCNVSGNNQYFISDGSYNHLAYGPGLTLASGTYKLTYSIDLISNTSEKDIFALEVSRDDGTKLVNAVTFSEEMINASEGKVEIEFSLGQQESGLEFRVLNCEGTVIRLNAIECEKISDDYTIGLDSIDELMILRNNVDSEKLLDRIIYMDNMSEKVSVEYLSKVLDKNVEKLAFDEVEALSTNNYIMVNKSDKQWFDLLDEYTVVENFKNYLILAYNDSQMVNEHENIYSDADKVEIGLWSQKTENKFIGGSYSGIPIGNYTVFMQIEGASDLSEDDTLIVNIKNGTAVMDSLTVPYTGDEIEIPIELATQIYSLNFSIYTQSGEYIESYAKTIVKEGGSTEKQYKESLYPMLDIIENIALEHTNLEVFDNTFEREGSLGIFDELIEEKNLSVVYNKIETDYAWEKEEADLLILPRNIQYIVNLLEDYIIIGKNSNYVLLVRDTPEYRNQILDNRIEVYSEENIILRSYFFLDHDEEISENINLSEGSYAARVDLYVVEESAVGQKAEISIYTGTTLIGYKEIEITEEMYQNNRISIEIPIASRESMNSIYLQIVSKEEGGLNCILNGIRYISNDYNIPLATCENISNAVDSAEGLKAASSDKMEFYQVLGKIVPGKYQIECYYTNEENADISFVLKSDSTLVRGATGEESKMDGDMKKITLTFTVKSGIKNGNIYFSSQNDNTMVLKYIILKKID